MWMIFILLLFIQAQHALSEEIVYTTRIRTIYTTFCPTSEPIATVCPVASHGFSEYQLSSSTNEVHSTAAKGTSYADDYYSSVYDSLSTGNDDSVSDNEYITK